MFDHMAEVIEQAAQDECYSYEASWLPWDDDEEKHLLLADGDRASTARIWWKTNLEFSSSDTPCWRTRINRATEPEPSPKIILCYLTGTVGLSLLWEKIQPREFMRTSSRMHWRGSIN
jgi:hypothetical protein